ncbi:hypothetical protein HYW74_00870 [Candidatus Pacearchaeota archaeon]|nr:hypothetical protein [Candidatus Pacearchaeota archaeon]
MRFFTFPIQVRIDRHAMDAIEELLEKYPDKYFSLSHVVRCAVLELRNETWRLEENELKRFENK